ncbi:MAG: type II toxin-antitoxin system RelE family toxin [Verrucomicrobiota bacterium]
MAEFQRAKHPEVRRALKSAILALSDGRGDIKALEDELAGFYRLRVLGYRVIYRILPEGDIDCVFAEQRKFVYELFAATLKDRAGK